MKEHPVSWIAGEPALSVLLDQQAPEARRLYAVRYGLRAPGGGWLDTFAGRGAVSLTPLGDGALLVVSFAPETIGLTEVLSKEKLQKLSESFATASSYADRGYVRLLAQGGQAGRTFLGAEARGRGFKVALVADNPEAPIAYTYTTRLYVDNADALRSDIEEILLGSVGPA